jgi:hypothetical protein
MPTFPVENGNGHVAATLKAFAMGKGNTLTENETVFLEGLIPSREHQLLG